MNVTETLAEFTANLKYEDIPGEVVQQAKRCILDNLGCALGGYNTDLGKIVVSAVTEFKCLAPSTIIGDGNQVIPHQAAFVNSALAYLLDFDDTSEGIGHPGCIVIPPALAVGEAEKVSGKDFLLAVVLAYEVSTRIGYGIKPTPSRMKAIFPATCWQIFSAAVVASKLLGLDKNQIVTAFGIAGVGAPLPASWAKHHERPQGWFKVNVSFASSNGVLAGYIARKGVPGSRAILDGDGLWVTAGSDTCDFDVMTSGLGKEYRIMAISFKPFPSVAWFHPANDAIATIMKEQKLKADDIQKIKISTFGHAMALDYAPQSIIDCECSLPYDIAMVIFGEPPGPGWYTEEMMNSKEVLNFMKKIRVEEDLEATSLFGSTTGAIQRATVDITTNDSRTFTARVDSKRGSAENPLSDYELYDKFRNLAVPVLKTEKTEEVIRMVDGLEEISDITSLAKIMKRST